MRSPLFARGGLPIAAMAAAALVVLVALVSLLLPAANAQPAPRIQVVTSTTVFADMVQRVGGDRVETFSLVPSGTDPHSFQPTPRDIGRAANARVAVWNGLGLDELAEEAVETLGAPDLVTVTLSEGVEPLAATGDEDDGHGEGNPHLWLDPTLAMRYVQQIRDGLSAADPANAAVYEQNASIYLAEIAEVDAWALGEVATIPVERRKLVTFHDAFPYLARHFGLELVGVVLKSPGREPSAQEVAELVNEISYHGIPTVYAEPQFNARILELAARDAGVRVRTLYSDALDDRVTNYLDLMRYNVTSLVEGLR